MFRTEGQGGRGVESSNIQVKGRLLGRGFVAPPLPPVCLNYPISAILLFIPQQSMLIQFQIHQWVLLLPPIINATSSQIYLQCLRMKRVTVMEALRLKYVLYCLNLWEE